MRGWLRRATEREFKVELDVHQLDSIPVTHRMMFIHWRLPRRDAGSPYYGFTPSREVEPGNCVRWESKIEFTARIPADPSDPSTLQRLPLQLQLRSERRNRIGVPTYNPEGVVEIDLAEVAAAGSVSRNYLVQESLLNATLRVTLRMTHLSGDRIFRTAAAAAASAAASTEGPAPIVPPVMSRNRSSNALTKLAMMASECPDDTQASLLNSSFKRKLSSQDIPGSIPYGDAQNGSASETLEYLVPDPEAVQSDVYEQVFWERLRDTWPEHITASRRNAVEVVDELYARICEEDGIKHGGGVKREYSRQPGEKNMDPQGEEQKMTVEGLLESLYA